jgi:hypothetical protein
MRTVSPFFTWRRAMTASELPSTTKLVLFVIAEYANAKDDICWPSVETLAAQCSLSERSVGTHLTIAEQAGWLTRWKSRRPARKWAHAHYRLSIPENVATEQIAAIEFDLAAGDDEPMSDELTEADAQEMGSLEESSGDEGDSRKEEPFSKVAQKTGSSDESYRKDFPTNKPVNRDTSKPSLSHTTVVSTGSGDQRAKFEEADGALARWMHGRVLQNIPDLPHPDLDEWAADIASMRSIDRRETQDIVRLFAWAVADKFWAKVLIAPARLRRNWDELRRRRNDACAVKRSAAPQSTSAPVADDRQCAHVEGGCRCTNPATTLIGAGMSRRGYCRKHIGHYED